MALQPRNFNLNITDTDGNVYNLPFNQLGYKEDEINTPEITLTPTNGVFSIAKQNIESGAVESHPSDNYFFGDISNLTSFSFNIDTNSFINGDNIFIRILNDNECFRSTETTPVGQRENGNNGLDITNGNAVIKLKYLGNDLFRVDESIDASLVSVGGFNPCGLDLNGPVRDIVQDGNGNTYIGGEFTQYGSTTYNRILKFNDEGFIDENFSSNNHGFNNTVYSLNLLPDGKLLVGGEFNEFTSDNTPIQPIVRLNTDGTLDNTYITDFEVNTIVYDIEVDSNGDYIIGTDLRQFGVNQANLLHKTDNLGVYINDFSIFTGDSVRKILIDSNNDIVLGGEFTEYNSIANNIVKIDSTGTLLTNYENGYNSIIYDIYEEADGSLLVGGDYTIKNTDTIIENFRLRPSVPDPFDFFSESTAIDGDYIIVGAPTNNQVASNDGAAYLYDINNLVPGNNTEEYILQMSDSVSMSSARFGTSVAILGDYVVIGSLVANGNTSNTGATYVFKISDLISGINTQDTKLIPSNGDTGDAFGSSVAINNNYIVVGAPNFNDRGAAFVYDISNLNGGIITETHVLTASDSGIGYGLGVSVSINDNYVVVGSSGDNLNGLSDAGSAYVYDINNFSGTNITEDFKLVASDAADNDDFGASVSISGNIIAVGSPLTSGTNNRGTGYIYDLTNLQDTGQTVNGNPIYDENFKLIPDNNTLNHFGNSISVNNGIVVVGAEQAGGSGEGDTYFFNISNLVPGDNLGKKLSPSNNASSFGNSVYIKNNYIVSGSRNSTAYVYNINDFNFETLPINSLSRLTNTNVFDPNNSLNQNISFNSGDIIYSIDKKSTNNIVIGGNYTAYSAKNYIVLNDTGIINNNSNEFNNSVFKVKTQTDNKVLVGGEYIQVNGQDIKYISRIKTDNTIDE